MICNFTVNDNAFNAIVAGDKKVELRHDNHKCLRQGDYIHFYNYSKKSSVYVTIDKTVEFADINEVYQKIPEQLWAFSPYQECIELINREFNTDLSRKTIIAIFFHIVKLSIIMPTYNSSPYILETLRCLSKQTFRDYELIILDDCSTDDTCDVVETFQTFFPIKIVYHTIHKGAALLRTEGLKIANGKYIIFLDSDDLFEKDYLMEMINILLSSDVDIAIAEYDSFNSDDRYNKFPYIGITPIFLQHSIVNPFFWEEIPFEYYYWTNILWNKMYSREFLLRIKVSFQNLPCSNDVFFSHYTMCLGKMRHIPSYKAMVHYRVNRENSISSKHDLFSEIKAYELLISSLEKCIPINSIYTHFIFGIMKCIRRGRGAEYEKFFKWAKATMEGNGSIPLSYIKDNHPWLITQFSEDECFNDIYRINYLVVYTVQKYSKELRGYFNSKLQNKTIGVLQISKELLYIIEVLQIKNDWVIEKDFPQKRPDIILSTSMLQLTDIETVKRRLGLNSVQTITLWDIIR